MCGINYSFISNIITRQKLQNSKTHLLKLKIKIKLNIQQGMNWSTAIIKHDIKIWYEVYKCPTNLIINGWIFFSI